MRFRITFAWTAKKRRHVLPIDGIYLAFQLGAKTTTWVMIMMWLCSLVTFANYLRSILSDNNFRLQKAFENCRSAIYRYESQRKNCCSEPQPRCTTFEPKLLVSRQLTRNAHEACLTSADTVTIDIANDMDCSKCGKIRRVCGILLEQGTISKWLFETQFALHVFSRYSLDCFSCCSLLAMKPRFSSVASGPIAPIYLVLTS